MNHSPEAEMAVIGCVLLGGWEDAKRLRPGDFYRESTQAFFSAVSKLCTARKEPEPAAIQAAMGGDYEKFGGADFLNDCLDFVAGPSQTKHFAGIVAAFKAKRDFKAFARELAEKADDPDFDPDDLPNFAQAGINACETGAVPMAKVPSIGDLLAEPYKSPPQGVATGIECFDKSNRHGGLAKGEPTYIGAETGVGKTVLGVQIASHVAEAGGNVLFGTFELTAEVLKFRVLCQQTGHWGLNDAERFHDGEGYRAACEKTSWWNLDVYDPARLAPGSETVESFCGYAASRKVPYSLIVVDYAQILRTRQEFREERMEVKHVGEELRMLAKRTGAAVLVLAQAVRDATEKKRLRLRDSRTLENGANAIILLDYRYETQETWLVVDKNRDGRRIKERVRLEQPKNRFVPFVDELGQDGVYRGGE